MIPGGAAASVSIKVDVDDAGAQARIAALEARLKALEKQFGGTGKGAQNYGKQLDDVSKKAGNNDKSNKNLLGTGEALKKMFGGLGKMVKYAGIEFGLMTIALGGMQLALWAGQTTMKGFHALLRATGAAAGVAVGAIATVLAAMRELQAVKLAPILGGIGNAKTQTNAYFADRRFAMFDQKTMASIMQSAAEQGQVIDAAFRNQLANLANYSLGDPKKLAEIQKTFQQIQKDGKVTAATYAQLQTASPALAKGFDEMAGGTKKGEAAAKAGSVSYKKFFDTVQAGKLKALEPFQGALDNINGTLAGRLKGAFTGIKEQLTRMGEPLLEGFKRPLTIIEREISLLVLKINGTVRKVFPTLFDVKNENNNSITRMFDKLAASINTNMGKISGWVESIKGWGNSISNFFGTLGDKLRHYSSGWDKLFDKVLKPFGQEFATTLAHLFDTFNNLIKDQGLGSFERLIHASFEAVRGLITGFGQLKAAVAPVLTIFTNMFEIISKLANLPFLQWVIPLMMMGNRMMGGKKPTSTTMGANGNVISRTYKGNGPGGRAMGMLGAPLMMGMGGFSGKNTKYASATFANYAANRNIGAGRIPSALLSSPLGFGFASNMRSGMGFRDSVRLSGSGSRMAMEQGFTNRKDKTFQGSIQATRQARIDALMANRTAAQLILGQTAAGDDIKKYMKNQGYDFVGGDPNAKKGSMQAGDHYTSRSPTGAPMTANQARALQAQEAKDVIAARRKHNAQAIRQGKLDAIQYGKLQGKAAGKAFVRDSAAKFGKAAGMMGATIGLTMLGGMIQQNAGTNTMQAGIGGAVGGIGMGVSMGAMLGLPGMIAGGLIGGTLGFITGSGNAKAQKKAEEKQGREYVQQTVFGNKTFNRSEDFKTARADAYKLQMDIDKIGDGPDSFNQEIRDIEARRDPTIAKINSNLLAKAHETFGENYDVTSDVSALQLMGDELLKNKNLTDQFVIDLFGDDRIPDSYSQLQDAISSVYDAGPGLVDAKIMEDLLAEKALIESAVGDIDSASSAAARALEKISDRERGYNEMINKTMYTLEGTGITQSEVATLFDELGMSIEETSVGIHEFNQLIGMTGDLATNIATGAGRMARDLLTQTQRDVDLAESRSRLEQVLEDTFALRGEIKPEDATISVGAALNEIVGNAMAELAAGNKSFDDLVGKGDADGFMQNQLEMFYQKAIEQGLSPQVIDALKLQIYGDGKDRPGLISDINESKTDPFKRAQYDGKFNERFTQKMDNLTNGFVLKVAEGAMTIPQALDGATDELVTYLKDTEGLTVTPETEEKLKNLLSGTIMNTPAAMAEAMRSAGMDVAAMIRAAMTGITIPVVSLVPNSPIDPTKVVKDNPWTLVDESKNGGKDDEPAETKIGDTTSSRFSRTMSSHNRFNAMVPGKRMVTSGLRNTNLGSMGSDHATGAAYDIVGDNLVSYANNVKTAGGFSEFHGDTASRHLHVVPPVGDTTSSRSVGYDSGSSTNNYSFQIHGDGADPQEIADAVMDRIARADRNRRERS